MALNKRFGGRRSSFRTLSVVVVVLGFGPVEAQWTNRYPLVDGFTHHVYLEGYQLPILSSGPIDPAASPDGRYLAFASDGWIWVLDLETKTARQITDGAEVDSRPRWAPDGVTLAFVRDDMKDTQIVIKNVATGESSSIGSPKIELDPEFSADGRFLFYSSAANGDLDIWRHDFASGASEPVTGLAGVERNPRLIDGGSAMVYLHVAGFSETNLRLRSFLEGTDEIILASSIAGQAMADSHPTARTIVFAWPQESTWRLLTADVDSPSAASEIVTGNGLPQMPTWSSDGNTIYFAAVDEAQQFHLMQVPSLGGNPKPVRIHKWDWSTPRATVRIRTMSENGGDAIPSRLYVRDATGHPVTSTVGATYFDSENGVNYFYSEGEVELSVPVGKVSITAAHGLMSVPQTVVVNVEESAVKAVEISVPELWDAAGAGWWSADFHFHMNYDGTYRIRPQDLEPLIHGENLDVATPLAANLHNRLQDREYEGEKFTSRRGRLIVFGQEVRSHFHGHIGLIGASDFYFPWHWGPGYPNYGRSDLSNSSVLDFIAERGGVGTYVHPVWPSGDAFSPENIESIPLEFVSDAVLGNLVGLEIACAWSDELSTASLWYRLLNIGQPVLAMAGTDMFADFHRTPAVGTTRTYVNLDENNLSFESFLMRLKAGHSFVTNAPALLFNIDGVGPGGVVKGNQHANWSINLTSAIAVDTVEVLINGEVVWMSEGIEAGEARKYSDSLQLPEGGWVAARAYGGETSWPAMDSYPFAHSSPIWITEVGSTDPTGLATAKADLLRALDSADARAFEAYGDADIATLKARLAAAREALQE